MTNGYIWILDFNYHGFVSSLVLRLAHKRGLFPVTSPCNWSPEEFTQWDWSQGFVPQTVLTKCFRGKSRRDLSKKFKWV